MWSFENHAKSGLPRRQMEEQPESDNQSLDGEKSTVEKLWAGLTRFSKRLLGMHLSFSHRLHDARRSDLLKIYLIQ